MTQTCTSMPQQSYPEWIRPDPWAPPRDAPPPAEPEHAPAPTPKERRWLLAAALFPAGAVIGFLAVLLYGWALGSHHSSRPRPAASAPPAVTTPPVTQPADPSASVLSRLVVNQSDVAPSVSVVLIPGGNQVVGQATLDLCNGDFP